jgi:hypothetical protein
MQPKSLFQSSTFRGAAIAAVITVIAGITPFASSIATRHYPKHRADIEDVAQIVLVLCSVLGVGSSGMAIAGRVSVGDIYTPAWMPGPNKEDFISDNLIPIDPPQLGLPESHVSPRVSSPVARLEPGHATFTNAKDAL